MKLLNKPNDKNHIVYEQEIREDILNKNRQLNIEQLNTDHVDN
jgi:hypothetical protein